VEAAGLAAAALLAAQRQPHANDAVPSFAQFAGMTSTTS
jgi:hypothetical protein